MLLHHCARGTTFEDSKRDYKNYLTSTENKTAHDCRNIVEDIIEFERSVMAYKIKNKVSTENLCGRIPAKIFSIKLRDKALQRSISCKKAINVRLQTCEIRFQLIIESSWSFQTVINGVLKALIKNTPGYLETRRPGKTVQRCPF